MAANATPSILAVDDFYDRPDEVRKLALKQEFFAHPQFHKGKRTHMKFLPPQLKVNFERLLNIKITAWKEHGANGVFQTCTAEDPIVFHADQQAYAGAIFLTPNSPPEAGTSFYRRRVSHYRYSPNEADAEKAQRPLSDIVNETFTGNFFDSTKWELVDRIGNVYNRLALWKGNLIHAASSYFGNTLEDCRLFHMFFFDAVPRSVVPKKGEED